VVSEADDGPETASELDVDHLADLANLPLDDGDREELAAACREVLDTFRLAEVDEEAQATGSVRTFADEADPWPEEGIEAILAAFPDRDGRLLRP
jgi:Asp-tRNA(Asn)/Glu-tRNA(Gln) amidotransferase C subunit